MNCDEAFDYLTDPERQHAAELNRHLEACPRCRQMQSTLEPALSLFEEPSGLWCDSALDSSESYSEMAVQDGTSTRAHPADLAFAQESAARLSRCDRAAAWSQRAVRFATRYAAVFFAGALAASAALSVPLKAQPCTWEQPDRVGGETVEPVPVVMACVDCHRSTTERIPAAAASVVLQCVACHQNSRGDGEEGRTGWLSASETPGHGASETPFQPLECVWPQSRS